jgi:hypothetical protein
MTVSFGLKFNVIESLLISNLVLKCALIKCRKSLDRYY